MKDDHEFKEVIHTIGGEGGGKLCRVVRTERQPMSDERFKFFCWFIAGIIGEVLGFAFAVIVALCLAGAFR